MKLVAFLVVGAIVGVNAQFAGNGGIFGSLTGSVKQGAQAVPGVNQASGALSGVLESQFNNFKSLKQYASEAEKSLRKNIFVNNGKEIENFNQLFAKGVTTFSQKLNDFADLATEEFNKLCNGFKVNLGKLAGFDQGKPFVKDDTKPIPDHVDWREKGAVSSVKTQGLCASCYAFSTTGALEGQHFLKTGKLVELSPQNLMDCGAEYGNEGCDGGFIHAAFEYAKKNQGVNTFNSYPYEAKGGNCRYDPNSVGSQCKEVRYVPKGNEKALEAAVATVGPIAVAIDASGPGFQFYKDGVYYDPKCGNQAGDVNHAVLLVGYGTEPNGQKYWLLKNSYGTKWGMDGYFKLAKDKGNHCGIATYAIFPVL